MMTPTPHPLSIHRAVVSTRGFSLIELLVVVSFMAILAALAVPRFHTVKAHGFDAAAKSDLRNALEAEEQYYAEVGLYEDFAVGPGGNVDVPSFQASTGVSVAATVDNGLIKIVSQHEGSDRSWCVSSVSGGIILGNDC